MLFQLNIKDNKKILNLNLEKKKLNNSIKNFLKLQHILIFDKPL